MSVFFIKTSVFYWFEAILTVTLIMIVYMYIDILCVCVCVCVCVHVSECKTFHGFKQIIYSNPKQEGL